MKVLLGDTVHTDLRKLIVSRLLIQANSGGGKSWALRRLLEQTHGHVQQIVIDPEDEFYTLREKFDYILARHEDGDCVPEVRSAELLATRLLELGVSAIISLYELHPRDRREFVRRFLESLVNAPRKLWHRTLVVVDEAHDFCPEQGKQKKGDAVADAVIGLMSKGRKRGFCGVLATQRLSKLNKDAAAETKNKLIGNAVLDVDRKRAAEELGFSSKAETLSLRNLEAGEFYGFGPAISRDVVKFRFGGVETTHPEAGSSPAPVAAPKSKVQSVLAKLADLPQEAEQERVTIADLQKKNRELQQQLRNADAAAQANNVLSTKAVKTETKTVYALKDSQIERINKLERQFEEQFSRLTKALDDCFGRFTTNLNALFARRAEIAKPINEAVAKVSTGAGSAPRGNGESAKQGTAIGHAQLRPTIPPAAPVQRPRSDVANSGEANLGSGPRKVAIAIAQRANGATREQLTTITGFRKSTRNRYLQYLTAAAMAVEQSGRFVMTQEGLDWLGSDYEPLPTGPALAEHWLRTLPEGQSKILRVVLDNLDGVSRDAITDATGFKKSTRNRYLQYLQSQELVIAQGELITPAPELFE
jgi:hypothetical protein